MGRYFTPLRAIGISMGMMRALKITAERMAEVADHVPGDDDGRLAGQHEKRRLEGVLGVLDMAQHAPAEAEHHRPVPPHQRLEGGLVATGDEAVDFDPSR